MTQLRQAAQQALEALDNERYVSKYTHIVDAITALRAALAEPVQEPVAWRWGYRSVTTGEMDWRGYVEEPAHPNLRSPAIVMEPLYTAPQRRPLTDEEIVQIELGLRRYNNRDTYDLSLKDFARAIERAHGIGESNV